MAAKSRLCSWAMEKPEQSGFSPEPQPLPTCTRPCSLTMRASLLLKQHLPVVCSMQATHLPKMRMHDEHQVPMVWHRPAPSFMASLPSSSLQDDIDMTM